MRILRKAQSGEMHRHLWIHFWDSVGFFRSFYWEIVRFHTCLPRNMFCGFFFFCPRKFVMNWWSSYSIAFQSDLLVSILCQVFFLEWSRKHFRKFVHLLNFSTGQLFLVYKWTYFCCVCWVSVIRKVLHWLRISQILLSDWY